MIRPHRRFRLTLSLDADDLDTLRQAFEDVAIDGPRSRTGGATSHSYHLDVTEDPTVTPDGYREALRAYLRSR